MVRDVDDLRSSAWLDSHRAYWMDGSPVWSANIRGAGKRKRCIPRRHSLWLPLVRIGSTFLHPSKMSQLNSPPVSRFVSPAAIQRSTAGAACGTSDVPHSLSPRRRIGPYGDGRIPWGVIDHLAYLSARWHPDWLG